MGGTCKTPLGSAILQDRSGLSLHFLAQISLSVARRTSHDLLLTDKHEGERAESSSPNPHRGQSRNQFLYLTLALPPATTQRPPSRLGSCQDLAGNLAFLAAGVFIIAEQSAVFGTGHRSLRHSRPRSQRGRWVSKQCPRKARFALLRRDSAARHAPYLGAVSCRAKLTSVRACLLLSFLRTNLGALQVR